MKYLKKISVLLVFNLALAGASRLAAEKMTLTDLQGRAITAEILEVEKVNGKVKIKREDGQIFRLSLDNLVTTDQKKLLALADVLEAAEAAKPIKPDAIKIDLSRSNFKTKSKNDGVETMNEENWGYTMTIANRTAKPMDGLRAEYRLFATVDNPRVKQDKQVLKKKSYQTLIPTIALMDKVVVRTESITVWRVELAPGWEYSETGRNESGERLYGIWLRLYRGDQLVQEISMPESLRTKEKW